MDVLSADKASKLEDSAVRQRRQLGMSTAVVERDKAIVENDCCSANASDVLKVA